MTWNSDPATAHDALERPGWFSRQISRLVGTWPLRNRHLLALDIILFALTPALALTIRLDSPDWVLYGRALILYTALALGTKISLFATSGLYRRYWQYASVEELLSLVLAVVKAMVIIVVIFLGVQTLAIIPGEPLPRSVPFIDGMLTLMVVSATRFSFRASESMRRGRAEGSRVPAKPVLVIGAGRGGSMVVREMRNSGLVDMMPVGFVDDDPRKQGMSIHQIPVLGTRQDIPRLVKEYGIKEVIIAMMTVPGRIIRETVGLCEKAGVPYKTIPGMFEILSGQVSIRQLRNVEIEDLLRRKQVRMGTDEIVKMVSGARVLVTGAGGSIGSELCRQIARVGPARLTMLGHGENSLYNMSKELKKIYSNVPVDVVLADVRDRERMKVIFERYRPQLVLHAAAHKHVPLMEDNIEEAVTTNVLGTQIVVSLAAEYEVERLVFISTDKAVNPTSVMGATKRVAELIVQEAARTTGRPFVSVRFGNVLGSRGSVLPLFRQQIAEGGPVTVTHPEVQRYFMTIPEAVQLVLQAAAIGQNGEVFVLDMGKPIKIVDLAHDLIELSGLEVGKDIDIIFTGMRPGEKMSEELFGEGEVPQQTKNPKLLVARARNADSGEKGENLDMEIDALVRLARVGEAQVIQKQAKNDGLQARARERAEKEEEKLARTRPKTSLTG